VQSNARVILDTGPLVALLNRRDTWHDWAKARFAGLAPPLMTCEPVLSEACFLLRRLPGAPQAVLQLIERGVLDVPFRLDAEAQALGALMHRYASVPMALADACLVRMAEQHPGSAVMTLDGDFRVYRIHGRKVVPTVMPDAC
jgi:predicted nucleic acid-binding protein